MKSLFKTALFSIAIATLTGCASMPDAPKTQAEMKQLGDDNLLHVPVDITNFKTSKLEIFSEEDKDACYGIFCRSFGTNDHKGIITVFTDPETGKTYDLDGQPINEKGQRILKNGFVCVVRYIYNNQRSYDANTWNEAIAEKFCKTSIRAKYQNIAQTSIAIGLATGGLGGITALAGNGVIAQIISGDTM